MNTFEQTFRHSTIAHELRQQVELVDEALSLFLVGCYPARSYTNLTPLCPADARGPAYQRGPFSNQRLCPDNL